MGTTSLGLPYPEASDRVADGWDAIRDLAEALNTLLVSADARLDTLEASGTDTAWTALTLSSGWTNYSGYGTAGYRRLKGIVHLRGLVQRAANGSANIATLPAGFRPAQTSLYVGSGHMHWQQVVSASGAAYSPYAAAHILDVGTRVQITSAGVITPPTAVAVAFNGAVPYLSLAGISYPADV